MKISYYNSIFNSTPSYNGMALDFFMAVKNGRWGRQIMLLRNEPNEIKRKAMKKQLPAVTLSGTFNERRSDGILDHSGLLVLDYDADENPGISDWAKFRNQIGTFNDVLFSGLSASGNGVFAVVKIDKPQNHEIYFNIILQSLKKKGINVDPSGKDITRLRFVSYDSHAIINPEALSFKRMGILSQIRERRIKLNDNNTSPFENLLQKVIESGLDITQGYKVWFTIGCCIANNMGESGREYFHTISSRHHQHNTTMTDKEYDKILKHRYAVSEGYIFNKAKEFGIMLYNK